MAKMRWGNGEQDTGGYPQDRMWKSRTSFDPANSDPVNTKRSPEPSAITFRELAAEFETDPQYLLNALRRRGVEPHEDTRLFDSDVKYIRWMFDSRLKPELRKERKPQSSMFLGKSMLERIRESWNFRNKTRPSDDQDSE